MTNRRLELRSGFARFCVRCAGPLAIGVPLDDTRERLMCTRCEHVHYENPRILVSCLVNCGVSVLLCRRAQQPALGLWAPPGGFLEKGETVEQGAARETLEEAGVVLDPQRLEFRRITTLTALGEVYIGFRARVVTRTCKPGPEALEARFFQERDVPWDQIAYPQIAAELRSFFGELAGSACPVDSSVPGPDRMSDSADRHERRSCDRS